MLRNVKVGRIALSVNEKEILVDVLEVRENDALCMVNGKEKVISIAALKTGKKVKSERSKSAIATAMEVLSEAMKPMKVSDIAAKVLEAGYEIPRGGQTFNITLSARLNDAAQKGKIKKVVKGIFADNNCDEKLFDEFVNAETKRSEKKAEKEKVGNELAELAAEFEAEA